MTVHVSISDWGRDHWQTLAFVESCCVDNNGRYKRIDQLRTNSHHWAIQSLRNEFLRPFPMRSSDYKTRLINRDIDNHDDWDCLLDMEREGVLIIHRPRVVWDEYSDNWLVLEPDDASEGDLYLPTGLMEGEREARELARGRWELTDYGRDLAGQLRAHLQTERSYASFRPRLAVSS